jgi:uncharacterized protein RhaS with RHS repeats
MIGGFISENPIGFAGDQPSFYAYVEGNPLSYVDPYGLWSVTLNFYYGFGGAVVFTGTGLSFDSIGFRGGVGIGAGIDINPFGSRPDGNAAHDSNSLGVFGEGSIGAGPLSFGAGGNYGFTQTIDPDGTVHYCGYGGREPELSSGKGHGQGFRLGGFEGEGEISAGIEVTHNF